MGASEKPSATSKMILPYCEALTPFSIDIHTWQCWCMMWCSNSTYFVYVLLSGLDISHFQVWRVLTHLVCLDKVMEYYFATLWAYHLDLLATHLGGLKTDFPSKKFGFWNSKLTVEKVYIIYFSRFSLIQMVTFVIQFVLFS